MMQRIHELVVKILGETLHMSDSSSIKSNNQLKEDLGLDSMSSLTFLMKLEEAIEGFYVDPDTLENKDLQTVGSITQYIKRQLLA